MVPNEIAIVSADPYRSKLLLSSLESAGFNGRIFDSGQSALEWLRSEESCTVVLDWKLPDISGLAVLRNLRADILTAEIPVILLGGDLSEAEKLIAFEAGADLCLAGPVNHSVFVARVRALLRRMRYQPGTGW